MLWSDLDVITCQVSGTVSCSVGRMSVRQRQKNENINIYTG